MKIILIQGDGIGPEVTMAAVEVVDSTGISIDWIEKPAGLGSLNKYGEVVPEETIQAIRDHGAALKGPFTTPSGGNQKSANFYIRQKLQLFACVRPIYDTKRNIDFVIVRENTEELYAAIEWMSSPQVATAARITTQSGTDRVADFAFKLCQAQGRNKVTIVHKANNLKLTEGMFLNRSRVAGRAYPNIVIEDMLVDTAALNVVQVPTQFDVIVTSNTFGDILSSVGATLMGGLGVAPSASFGDNLIVSEATHGSAPELANSNRANPNAMISSAAMLLDAKGYVSEASWIRKAIIESTEENIVTPDLGGMASTQEVGREIANRVKNMSLQTRK